MDAIERKSVGKLLLTVIAIIIGTITALYAMQADAGDCGVLFSHRSHAAVVSQPVIVQGHHTGVLFANPYQFQVGQNLVEDALAEKIAAKVMLQLSKQTQVVQSSQKSVASSGDTVSPKSSATENAVSILSQKCIKCHSGTISKGGVNLDVDSIDDSVTVKIVDMLYKSRGVPDAMKPIVSSMTNEQKGQLLDELLDKSPGAR